MLSGMWQLQPHAVISPAHVAGHASGQDAWIARSPLSQQRQCVPAMCGPPAALSPAQLCRGPMSPVLRVRSPSPALFSDRMLVAAQSMNIVVPSDVSSRSLSPPVARLAPSMIISGAAEMHRRSGGMTPPLLNVTSFPPCSPPLQTSCRTNSAPLDYHESGAALPSQDIKARNQYPQVKLPIFPLSPDISRKQRSSRGPQTYHDVPSSVEAVIARRGQEELDAVQRKLETTIGNLRASYQGPWEMRKITDDSIGATLLGSEAAYPHPVKIPPLLLARVEELRNASEGASGRACESMYQNLGSTAVTTNVDSDDESQSAVIGETASLVDELMLADRAPTICTMEGSNLEQQRSDLERAQLECERASLDAERSELQKLRAQLQRERAQFEETRGIAVEADGTPVVRQGEFLPPTTTQNHETPAVQNQEQEQEVPLLRSAQAQQLRQQQQHLRQHQLARAESPTRPFTGPRGAQARQQQPSRRRATSPLNGEVRRPSVIMAARPRSPDRGANRSSALESGRSPSAKAAPRTAARPEALPRKPAVPQFRPRGQHTNKLSEPG